MLDLEHSAKGTGLELDQHTAASDDTTTHEALRSAKEAEQEASDVGTLGVREDGDLADVDPLAIGLNDTASSLGDVVPK
jgi:hypothetical protein